MKTNLTPEAVEEFLRTTKFSGYQSVPLPFGLTVPGTDRKACADRVLPHDLNGKSVLDIGTYYGYFLVEALRRGAVSATGVEADPERVEIARAIGELHGNRYEIIRGRLEDIDLSRKFDVVLFLNVLHHVKDPIEAIRRLASLTRERLVVEFSVANSPSLLKSVSSKDGSRILRKAKARLRAAVLDFVAGDLPVITVGNRPYHRTFFFNPEAFKNLFVTHLQLFEDVEIRPSPASKFRRLAICRPISTAEKG
jgi:2-polyprenyl-3-methyl-5-hydroxy-6-metoxy-1,4-benzoquinol methylase